MPSRLYVGLDAGGSKTELLARVLRPRAECSEWRRRGPGANLKRVGMAQATRTLAGLVREALGRFPGVRLGGLCAGVAGAGGGSEQEQLAGRLRRALGCAAEGARVECVHDARIALEAAFPEESGLVVGAGTGSVVLGRTTQGSCVRAGGWGPRFGDQGSGYALGRAGLRAVAAAHDGGPQTSLQALLAREHGMETRADILRRIYDEDYPVQKLAESVLRVARDGDAVAASLLREQTERLARQVSWLVGTSASMVPRIGLFGGLTNAPVYVEALQAALGTLLPRWAVTVTPAAPVEGAVHLALQEHSAPTRAIAPCAASGAPPG